MWFYISLKWYTYSYWPKLHLFYAFISGRYFLKLWNILALAWIMTSIKKPPNAFKQSKIITLNSTSPGISSHNWERKSALIFVFLIVRVSEDYEEGTVLKWVSHLFRLWYIKSILPSLSWFYCLGSCLHEKLSKTQKIYHEEACSCHFLHFTCEQFGGSV